MRWQSARYVIRHCAVCLCQACSHWLRSSSRAAGTQMVPGLPCVRLAWGLVVEGRNHDDSGGSEFSGCGNYVSHRAVKQGFVFGIFREDESLESGADGRYLYISALKGLSDFIYACGKSSSPRFISCHAMCLHIIEHFVQCAAWGYAFLKRQVQHR